MGRGSKTFATVGALLTMLANGREAQAADEAPATSYAWQTLALDGAAIAVTVTGVAMRIDSWPRTTLLTRLAIDDPRGGVDATDIGVGLYTFGTPIVHVAHGHPVSGLASVAMRVAGPTLGLVAGVFFGGIGALIVGDCSLMKGCRNDEAADAALIGGASVGLALGFAGPALIDAIYLARDPAPIQSAPSSSASPIRFAPRVALVPGGASVGLSLLLP